MTNLSKVHGCIDYKNGKLFITSQHAFCVLDFFELQASIDFTDLATTIGSYLCLNTEGLEEITDRLCLKDKRFTFKSDAGVKQLQIKNADLYLKEEMLNKVYLG